MALQDYIDALKAWNTDCVDILCGVEDGLDWRTISAYNMNAHGGIGFVACANRAVLADLIEAMQYFVYGATAVPQGYYWGVVHQGLYDKEVEITWRAICEAWVKNDFEGMEWTIACIDRMRTLMWDRPFNIRWAARPTAETT